LIETYYLDSEEGRKKLQKDKNELEKRGLVLQTRFIVKDETKNQTFIKALWRPKTKK
jgi:hypothetical protein